MMYCVYVWMMVFTGLIQLHVSLIYSYMYSKNQISQLANNVKIFRYLLTLFYHIE